MTLWGVFMNLIFLLDVRILRIHFIKIAFEMPVKHRLKPCGGHMSFSAPYAANPARIGI